MWERRNKDFHFQGKRLSCQDVTPTFLLKRIYGKKRLTEWDYHSQWSTVGGNLSLEVGVLPSPLREIFFQAQAPRATSWSVGKN